MNLGYKAAQFLTFIFGPVSSVLRNRLYKFPRIKLMLVVATISKRIQSLSMLISSGAFELICVHQYKGRIILSGSYNGALTA